MDKHEKKQNHIHTHDHKHGHEKHEHSPTCFSKVSQVSKKDRLLILLLVILLAGIFLRPFLAFQSFMRGYSYTELNEPLKAVKHLKRSLYLNDKNDQAWSFLGYNLKKLNRIEESKQAYKKALELNPEDYQAAVEYALLYFYEKKYDKAAAVLEKYLKKSQEQLGGWLILARCYEKIGDRERAVKTYRLIYKEIDPDNAVAKEKLAYYNSL